MQTRTSPDAPPPGAGRIIAIWFLHMAALAGVVQVIALLLGDPDWLIAERSGHSILGLIMILAAVAAMARSGRPLATFGLAIAPGWSRRFLRGAGIGALFMGVYIAIALLTFSFRPGRGASIVNTLEASFEALGALPLGVTATLVFIGFAPGALRLRFPPFAASIGAALLFALLYLGIPSDDWRSAAALRLTEFLALAALALVRFRSGDVALPAGIFVGALYIERFARKSALIADQTNPAVASLFAPNENLFAGPAIWPLLLIACVLAYTDLRRRGEQAHAPAIARSFKRTYPFATMGALAPLDVWLRELARIRFAIDPPYIPRLIATLILSAFNTILTLPERLILRLLLRNRRIPPPVFILGVHRSGTTHLQNLLALDPNLASPTTWQVMNPHGFLLSGRLIKPIVAGFMPWTRPMDAVPLGPEAPAEEEFAIANMSGHSPDWSLRFPKMADHYERFCYPERMTNRERARRRRVYIAFLRRFGAHSRNRRPLLKNPWNTARAAELAELFPGARFIHIRRDPLAVYRSYMHMIDEGHILFRLQDLPPREDVERRFLENYRAMESAWLDAASELPEGQSIDIQYKDLVADPRAVIRRIYAKLDLDYNDDFDARLTDYLERANQYRPNRHAALPNEKRARVRRALAEVVDRYANADRNAPQTQSPALAQRK